MWRFRGGSQRIALRMAKQVGRRVILGSPARRIEQDGRRLRVISERVEVSAKRVIVAVPPEVAGHLRYEPSLPAARTRLNRHLRQGRLIKAAAVYDTPFWRDDGLTGTAVATGGPVNATFDDSPPSGRPGVVFGFIGGDNARAHRKLSRARRRAAVLANYVDFFGPKAAAEGLLRDRLVAQPVDPRLPGRDRGAGHPHRVWPGAAEARRPNPLGGHGDLHLLERVHGRGRALRRAGRRRGPPRAVRHRRGRRCASPARRSILTA
jgi:hypothetical protein